MFLNSLRIFLKIFSQLESLAYFVKMFFYSVIAKVQTHFLKISKSFLYSLKSKNYSILYKETYFFYLPKQKLLKICYKTEISKMFLYLSKKENLEN